MPRLIAAAKSIIVLSLAMVSHIQACTTIAINANATLPNAAMTIHTTDCESCDSRLALVPGRHHQAGAKHAVFGIAGDYPRQVSNRSTVYQHIPKAWAVEPVGFIPEVEYTFGVWESTYTLMNEVGLTFGESSCTGKIIGTGVDMVDPVTGKPGEALLSISALMQLGLERCRTAVCAVKTMGALAEKYGFYGESLYGAEALSLADVTGDAWVFHVQQTFTSNTSAIWAAQRVPSGHMAVVANEFTIQEIPRAAHRDFLHSANMKSEAIAAGFLAKEDEDKPFNFQRVYGTKSTVGTNYYATVRQHWLYSNVAPSLNLTVKASPVDLPFSVKVEKKLDLKSLMDLFRGHYEGTDHDLTKGILAGPFGNPKRIEGGPGLAKFPGAFARGISITRTSHTHLGYAHPESAACFYSPDEPQSGVFAPFFTKTLLEAREVPLNKTSSMYSSYYQVMRRDQFSKDSAWWAFDVVANWMNLNFRNMSVEVVTPMVSKWQKLMLSAYATGESTEALKAQNALVEAWWLLFEKLIVQYNDGVFNFFAPGEKRGYERIGYPAGFLEDIRFDSTFWKSVTVTDQINKACKHSTENHSIWVRVPYVILGALAGLGLGEAYHRTFLSRSRTRAAQDEPLLSNP